MSDGIYNVKAFCSNCEFKEGESFEGNIYGFDVSNILKQREDRFDLVEVNDLYHIKGQLIEKENKIVEIGEFKIDLSDGNLPQDIEKNDYIEVDILRIDIY